MLTSFEQAVLKKLVQVPAGRVTTYKLLAKALDRPKSARAVGNALNNNPELIKTPCHRVVCSDGRVGGYRLGIPKKIFLLKKENIKITKGRKIIDFSKRLYKF